MNIYEIIISASFMDPNDGYRYIDANIDKTAKFTVKANGKTLHYIGLEKHKNTYRIQMQRVNTGQQFLITSHKFEKRIRRKTWTQFMVHKRKKLIL